MTIGRKETEEVKKVAGETQKTLKMALQPNDDRGMRLISRKFNFLIKWEFYVVSRIRS